MDLAWIGRNSPPAVNMNRKARLTTFLRGHLTSVCPQPWALLSHRSVLESDLALTGCVTLGRLLNLSDLPFAHV